MKKYTLHIILFLFTFFELFAQDVATVTALSGKANVLRNTQSIAISLGLKLQESDHIITGAKSKIQIIFKDDTVISIGKNSNFSIKEYLFEENQEPVANFGLLKGAMQTITGKIGKIAPQKFKVTTKTTTIGIRGTNFTISLSKNDVPTVYCTYGEVTVTINNQVYIVEQGFQLTILDNGSIEIKDFSPQSLREMRDIDFGISSNFNKDASENTDSDLNANASEDTDTLQNFQANTAQLDMTVNDTTDVTILETVDDISENIVNSKTLSTTIANYSMEDAIYFGSYTTSQNNSSLTDNGDVKLSINFNQDFAKLEFGSFSNPAPSATFEFVNVNSNVVSGSQLNGEGSANIEFYGPTGNLVNGDFFYTEGSTQSATGSYSAQTFETLK